MTCAKQNSPSPSVSGEGRLPCLPWSNHPPLRTLFYGMTHEHAPGKILTLRNLPEVFDVVAIADDRPRGAPSFVTFPFDAGTTPVVSEAEALALPDIDVVFIETANRDLMDVARIFADRGIPMHCDKPCGESLDPYRMILGTCRAKSLPFQIGYMYRGNPALKWLWRFVAEGGLGDIRFIEADMNHDYQADGYAEYLSTFRGGILYNLGCHLVDTVLPMVRGDLLETHPFTDVTRGSSFLRFGGTDVLIRTSANMPGGILARRLRVDGTKGTVDLCPIERFDGKNLTLTLTVGETVKTMDFGVQTDRYADQLLDLAAIIRGEKPNDQDYDRDLRTHEITLKACGL